MRRIDKTKKVVRVVLLIILSFLVIFPIFYLFSSSLFSTRDFSNLRIIPEKANWSNYVKALSQKRFPIYIINSTLTSLSEAFIRTIIVLFASFAFTHLNFKGKRVVFSLIILSLFIPSDAILYQNYRTILKLGLIDSYLAIILPFLFSSSQMLLLISFLKTLDSDYYGASQIDGAGDLQYIFRILAPLSQSVIITIFIQTLITSFNRYLWPLLVTNRAEKRTIQIALTMLGFAESGEMGAEMATIVIVTLPFLILLIFTKKRIESVLIKK